MDHVLTDEQELEVVRRYQAGEGSTVLARAFGASVSTICNLLARRNVVLRRAGGAPGRGRTRILDAEQEAAVLVDYKANKPLQEIADEQGVHVQTIYCTLERHGIEKRPKIDKQNKVSDDQEKTIVTALRAGACGRDLAAAIGLSASTISNIRRRARLTPATKGRRTDHLVDHDAFKNITPANCYWTGMLFADGGLDYNHGTPIVILELARRDRKHVEKFRSFLKSDYAISDVLHKNSYSRSGLAEASAFRARSQTIADALEVRGMQIKKAVRIPNAAMVASRDFWRGEVDGDGWLGTAENKGYIYPHIGLSGQTLILETFRKFLFDRKFFVPNVHPTDSGIWRVHIDGAHAESIIKLLYENNTVALDRKNVRAQSIITGNITKFPPYVEGPNYQQVDI